MVLHSSVDGGRGICPLFSSPPRGFDSSRVPTPGNLPFKAKKKANAQGSARGGGGLVAAGIDWCIPSKRVFIFDVKYRGEVVVWQISKKQ